ncbi:MAG TPA: urease accessory protein UreE [Stellaceae bacterium]|jgi:urease accessory protein|nr:urease accessory protein UreE [Stellaceae bacterium]
MHHATRAERAGHWPDDRAEGAATLAYDDRHRRRVRLTTDGGEEFLLDLPHAVSLEDGDGLRLDDGRWIAVRAAAESLIEVTAEPTLLTRLAWHLGNRHLPARIEPRRILIRRDHVIADMLSKLGATLRLIEAPFTPERGAYDQGHAHDPAHADAHHDHE